MVSPQGRDACGDVRVLADAESSGPSHSVDREQVRREKFHLANAHFMHGYPTMKCPGCVIDALLVELEQAEERLRREQQAADAESEALTLAKQQAERERDEQNVLRMRLLQAIEQDENELTLTQHKLENAEAQLVKVPALVEALRRIRASGFAKTGVSGYPEKYAKGDYRLEALAEIADEVLAKWEQAQGEKP